MQDEIYIQKLRNRIGDLNAPESNKRAAERFYSFQIAKNAKPRTIALYLYALEKFLIALGKTELKKATREDIEDTVAKINVLELSDRTKREIRTTLKMFYKHTFGDDLFYPKQVAWIKTSKPKRKLLPESILSEEEVLKMLSATKNVRDKALIALLYDSGIRIGELVNLKKKDIDLASTPSHIIVDGKTGQRKIPIFFSVPYLAQYLSTIRLEDDSPLLLDARSWNEQATHHAIRVVLKKTGKEAGIKKRIYPHLFRHSRASYYANKLTEQQLKEYFGWTKDSNMLSIYVHLSGRDVDNALSHANGIAVPEIEMKPKLTIKACQRCQQTNTADSVFCSRCGSPLDIKTAMNLKQNEDVADNAAIESMSDKQLEAAISHELLMRQYERLKRRGIRKS